MITAHLSLIDCKIVDVAGTVIAGVIVTGFCEDPDPLPIVDNQVLQSDVIDGASGGAAGIVHLQRANLQDCPHVSVGVLVVVFAVLVAGIQPLRSLSYLTEIYILDGPVADVKQIDCGRVAGDNSGQSARAVVGKHDWITRRTGMGGLECARGPDAPILQQDLIAGRIVAAARPGQRGPRSGSACAVVVIVSAAGNVIRGCPCGMDADQQQKYRNAQNLGELAVRFCPE